MDFDFFNMHLTCARTDDANFVPPPRNLFLKVLNFQLTRIKYPLSWVDMLISNDKSYAHCSEKEGEMRVQFYLCILYLQEEKLKCSLFLCLYLNL